MNEAAIKAALEITEALGGLGTEVIVAGGAARDHLLGREIKDIDLFVIGGEAGSDLVEGVISSALEVLWSIPDVRDISLYDNYRDNPGRVAYVIKFKYRGFDFDLIEYMTPMPTPRAQVENFDTSLSMVYFLPYAEDGENFTLVPVPHPEFIKTLMSKMVKVLPTLDGPRNDRLKYLQEKYPQFLYPFLQPGVPLERT